eukprot:571250-Prymnesium_polylepis.1
MENGRDRQARSSRTRGRGGDGHSSSRTKEIIDIDLDDYSCILTELPHNHPQYMSAEGVSGVKFANENAQNAERRARITLVEL